MKRSYIEISQPITQTEEIIHIIKKIENEYFILLYGKDYKAGSPPHEQTNEKKTLKD